MSRKSLLAATCAALCTGVAAGVPAAGAATVARTTLSGTSAPAALQGTAAGAVSAATKIDFNLVLNIRDQAGAEALVQAVSTPGSAQYRHYLTAAEWEARFSPTVASVAATERWLASQGFAVGKVSKDRITIAASGTAAQVESAFGTTLENYTIAGHTERMAASDLSIPTSLAGIVAGAMGVNQTVATPDDTADGTIQTSSTASATTGSTVSNASVFPPAPPIFVPHGPCSNSYGETTTTVTGGPSGYPSTVPDIVCGYEPGQFRSAYGLTSANTGSGVTVAVVDAYGSTTIASDATRYFNTYAPNEPFSSANFTQLDQTPFDDQSECGASGWAPEQAIDVEAVHSMAPDAKILYVGAQDCVDGLFTADQTVIDAGLANVITNSWGDDAGDLLDDAAYKEAFDDEFILADSTGITVQFSSGDEGDNFALYGFSAADYPTESPYVTSVGGTTLAVGADGTRTAEYGWVTGASYQCTLNLLNVLPGCTASAVNTWLPVSEGSTGGGFTSYSYPQPWYQAGVVPTALSERNGSSSPARVDPDISLDAYPGTGFLIGLHQMLPSGLSIYATTRYGGTSLASPLLAGIIADADQAAGTALGFINPALYRMDVSDPSSILDILPSSNIATYRSDFAGQLGLGLVSGTFGGAANSYRELNYSGPEVYCDTTGNCATRPETLSTATGYDSLTGLGSPGTNFIDTLAAF